MSSSSTDSANGKPTFVHIKKDVVMPTTDTKYNTVGHEEGGFIGMMRIMTMIELIRSKEVM